MWHQPVDQHGNFFLWIYCTFLAHTLFGFGTFFGLDKPYMCSVWQFIWYFPRCWAAWWYHVLLHLLLCFPWSLKRTLVFWPLFHNLFSFICDRFEQLVSQTKLDCSLYSSIGLKSTSGDFPRYNIPEPYWSAWLFSKQTHCITYLC